MATAVRETVLAALEAALAGIASVPGLRVARNRRAPVDGERDLAAGPLIVLRDGDQERLASPSALAHYRATARIEAFARADTAGSAETTLEALYAAIASAVETDPGLVAAAFRVRAGDVIPGIDAEAGHRSAAAYLIPVVVEYHTAADDPSVAA